MAYIFQPERVLLRKQLKEVGSFVRGKVLDVGAGSFDRYSEFFSADSYTRMEIEAGPGIDVVGTVYAIPFPDNSFDTLVSTQVFEHLARPTDAAQELFRVLKPGGYVVLTAPQANELHEEPHDYFRYTSYGLTSLFTTAGFEVVKMLKRGGYHALIAQMRIRFAIDHYQLYSRPMLGWVMGKFLSLYGRYMLMVDRHDHSDASRKHTLGWCVVLKK
jgi:SAM-dependent methyltransferase